MIFISHRGNINGINKKFENNPAYIHSAINKGYNVEIDVWYKNAFFLGHDKPQFKVSKKFLENKKLWCHAKNLEALEKLQKIKTKYFWHQEDDYTITSRGFVWVYPGKPLVKNSICVIPEKHNNDYSFCYGICTDYLNNYIDI